jgi:hypothetical protein
VNGNIELVKLIQEERQRYIHDDRLARLAAAVRACCSPTRLERIAHALRRTPATS